MEWLLEKVMHPRFGEGTIKAFNGHVMQIDFAESSIRAFPYPLAFETHLHAVNPSLQSQIDGDLAALRQECAEKAARRLETVQALQSLSSAHKKAPSARNAPRAQRARPARQKQRPLSPE